MLDVIALVDASFHLFDKLGEEVGGHHRRPANVVQVVLAFSDDTLVEEVGHVVGNVFLLL